MIEFPYGTIATEIPPEFVPVETWPEYGYIAGPAPFCKREYVGDNHNAIRWSAWPLTFEQHIGDDEPDLEKSKQGELAYNRFVTWRRVRRADTPKGWHSSSQPAPQIDGVRLLNGNITEGWGKNARHDARIWLEKHAGISHVIERVSLDEYDSAYRTSLIATRVNKQRIKYLRRKLALPEVAAHTELWGVRDLSTNAIVAGTALIHSPTHKGSTHFAPFIHEEARRIYAATALIHHWFSRATERGDRFVATTNFWFPGKDKSWKGFSEFKSHFGWQYIAYPPELWRFVRGKLF